MDHSWNCCFRGCVCRVGLESEKKPNKPGPLSPFSDLQALETCAVLLLFFAFHLWLFFWIRLPSNEAATRPQRWMAPNPLQTFDFETIFLVFRFVFVSARFSFRFFSFFFVLLLPPSSGYFVGFFFRFGTCSSVSWFSFMAPPLLRTHFFLVALIFIFCGLGRIDFLRFVISFFPIFPLYGQDGCVLLSTLFDEPLLVSLVSMLSVSLSLSLYPVRHLNGWIDSVLPFFGSFSDGVSVISPPSPPHPRHFLPPPLYIKIS